MPGLKVSITGHNNFLRSVSSLFVSFAAYLSVLTRPAAVFVAHISLLTREAVEVVKTRSVRTVPEASTRRYAEVSKGDGNLPGECASVQATCRVCASDSIVVSYHRAVKPKLTIDLCY